MELIPFHFVLLRFASYILNIKEPFGDVGVFIIERIVDHGRLSFNHLLTEYEKYIQSNSNSVDNLSTSATLTSDKIALRTQLKEAFDALISSRHIKSSPLFIPSRSTLLEQQHAQDVTRKSSSATAAANNAYANLNNPSSANANMKKAPEAVTRKRRVTTPYPSKHSSEFDSVVKEVEDDGLPLELRMLYKLEQEKLILHEEEAELEFEPMKRKDVNAVPQAQAQAVTAVVDGSKKRKGGAVVDTSDAAKDAKKKKTGRVVMDEDEDEAVRQSSNHSSSQVSKSPVPEMDGIVSTALWELNWDQYFRMKRHAVCVTYCKERLGNLAGILCKHLLDYSIKYESGIEVLLLLLLSSMCFINVTMCL